MPGTEGSIYSVFVVSLNSTKYYGSVKQGRLVISITMDICHLKLEIQCSVLNWLTVFFPMSSVAKLRELTNIEEKANPSNVTAG